MDICNLILFDKPVYMFKILIHGLSYKWVYVQVFESLGANALNACGDFLIADNEIFG